MIAKADAKVMKRDAVEETWNPFIAVTDQIIVDFCEFMGGQEAAMPIVRQQLTRAGIDVKAPTKEGLRLAVDYLAEAESSFRNAADVEASKLRRLGWIKEFSELQRFDNVRRPQFIPQRPIVPPPAAARRDADDARVEFVTAGVGMRGYYRTLG